MRPRYIALIIAVIFITSVFAVTLYLTVGAPPMFTETATSMVATTTRTAVTNSSNQLQLSLQLSRYGNGSFTVTVEDFNVLNSTDNVAGIDGWSYNPYALNPYDSCPSPLPLGFALAEGYYTTDNLSSALPLPLYNTTILASCSLSVFTGEFAFRAMSDIFTQDAGTAYPFTDTAQLSFLVSGYYTGGQGTSSSAKLNGFDPGVYTIIAADEWSEIILLYFTVQG